MAFIPVTSAKRLAALPVGAAQIIDEDGYINLNNLIIAFTTVVLPVPGPPVIIINGLSKNTSIACICVSSYVMPKCSCISSKYDSNNFGS